MRMGLQAICTLPHTQTMPLSCKWLTNFPLPDCSVSLGRKHSLLVVCAVALCCCACQVLPPISGLSCQRCKRSDSPAQTNKQDSVWGGQVAQQSLNKTCRVSGLETTGYNYVQKVPALSQGEKTKDDRVLPLSLRQEPRAKERPRRDSLDQCLKGESGCWAYCISDQDQVLSLGNQPCPVTTLRGASWHPSGQTLLRQAASTLLHSLLPSQIVPQLHGISEVPPLPWCRKTNS